MQTFQQGSRPASLFSKITCAIWKQSSGCNCKNKLNFVSGQPGPLRSCHTVQTHMSQIQDHCTVSVNGERKQAIIWIITSSQHTNCYWFLGKVYTCKFHGHKCNSGNKVWTKVLAKNSDLSSFKITVHTETLFWEANIIDTGHLGTSYHHTTGNRSNLILTTSWSSLQWQYCSVGQNQPIAYFWVQARAVSS